MLHPGPCFSLSLPLRFLFQSQALTAPPEDAPQESASPTIVVLLTDAPLCSLLILSCLQIRCLHDLPGTCHFPSAHQVMI